ncbi:SIMPL domain-containing protein [Marinilabiliaceae bacterium JC017]|nr:SIMPL domain-containing protein [Marinilabiliaceae bacterium JC017]
MKKIVFLVLLIASTYSANAQSGAKNFIDKNYIEVTGKAEMEIAPDLIYVTIKISEKDNKAKQSLEQLEDKMLKTLRDIGIDLEKDFSINDFASNFQFYWLKKTDIFTSKEYQVVVHDTRTLGKIFRELEKLNISNIEIAKLDHSKIEDYRREVKVKAIQEAKEKAEELMEAVDQKVGKAIFVQELNRHFYGGKAEALTANTVMKVRGTGDFGIADELNIEFQKIELEYEILVRFELP